jgi:hypothetical protein
MSFIIPDIVWSSFICVAFAPGISFFLLSLAFDVASVFFSLVDPYVSFHTTVLLIVLQQDCASYFSDSNLIVFHYPLMFILFSSFSSLFRFLIQNSNISLPMHPGFRCSFWEIPLQELSFC